MIRNGDVKLLERDEELSILKLEESELRRVLGLLVRQGPEKVKASKELATLQVGRVGQGCVKGVSRGVSRVCQECVKE